MVHTVSYWFIMVHMVHNGSYWFIWFIMVHIKQLITGGTTLYQIIQVYRSFIEKFFPGKKRASQCSLATNCALDLIGALDYVTQSNATD